MLCSNWLFVIFMLSYFPSSAMYKAAKLLCRQELKILRGMPNRISKISFSSDETCPPPPPCPCPPPKPELPPSPEPPPCQKLPPPCPPPLCAKIPDPANPCNYCPPTCIDPDYPDLTRLKRNQCKFQENMNRRNQQHQEPPRTHVDRMALLRPPEKTRSQKVKDFFWDSKKKTCLTRSPINWLSISIYYFIFVAVVLLVFYLCMLLAVVIASQKGDRPHYILGESPIGSSPGLNHFPIIEGRNLIWLSKTRNYKMYVDAINSVFHNYKTNNANFDPSKFQECGVAPFGYSNMTPCFFLRLNRLILWKPKPYRKGDQLPSDMPDSIKKKIESESSPRIWVSCSGTTAKDCDHLTPDFFHFQGAAGFDPSPYPFERQKDFLDPIVAIKFVDSKPNRVLYSFTCKAWARKLDPKTASVNVAFYFE